MSWGCLLLRHKAWGWRIPMATPADHTVPLPYWGGQLSGEPGSSSPFVLDCESERRSSQCQPFDRLLWCFLKPVESGRGRRPFKFEVRVGPSRLVRSDPPKLAEQRTCTRSLKCLDESIQRELVNIVQYTPPPFRDLRLQHFPDREGQFEVYFCSLKSSKLCPSTLSCKVPCCSSIKPPTRASRYGYLDTHPKTTSCVGYFEQQ